MPRRNRRTWVFRAAAFTTPRTAHNKRRIDAKSDSPRLVMSTGATAGESALAAPKFTVLRTARVVDGPTAGRGKPDEPDVAATSRITCIDCASATRPRRRRVRLVAHIGPSGPAHGWWCTTHPEAPGAAARPQPPGHRRPRGGH